MQLRNTLLAAFLLTATCTFHPKVDPNQLDCKDDNGCPSGYRCVDVTVEKSGFCCKNPIQPCAAGLGHRPPMTEALPAMAGPRMRRQMASAALMAAPSLTPVAPATALPRSLHPTPTPPIARHCLTPARPPSMAPLTTPPLKWMAPAIPTPPNPTRQA